MNYHAFWLAKRVSATFSTNCDLFARVFLRLAQATCQSIRALLTVSHLLKMLFQWAVYNKFQENIAEVMKARQVMTRRASGCVLFLFLFSFFLFFCFCFVFFFFQLRICFPRGKNYLYVTWWFTLRFLDKQGKYAVSVWEHGWDHEYEADDEMKSKR